MIRLPPASLSSAFVSNESVSPSAVANGSCKRRLGRMMSFRQAWRLGGLHAVAAKGRRVLLGALTVCGALSGCGKGADTGSRADGAPTSSGSQADSSILASREPPTADELASLKNPENCRECHPGQFEEWAGSMHAYASLDPVFRAMNQRGQEETGGALGDFCLACHAPMAVRDGLTKEKDFNLDELPVEYQGITCYFCHSVEQVGGKHNNPLELAQDGVMRGPFDDSAGISSHRAGYSAFVDSKAADSSQMCGACHDIVLEPPLIGSTVNLERTYAEWEDGLFSIPDNSGFVSTCVSCHMKGSSERDRVSVSAGSPQRRGLRRHDFEAIDLAMTDFPGRERQRVLTERFLDGSLIGEICVAQTGAIKVTMENGGAGHSWPSGATQDRRAWLEVKAYTDPESDPVFETGDPEQEGAPPGEGNALVLRDHVVDENGDPAHMFWDVAEVRSSMLIPGRATKDPLDPLYHRERQIWTLNTEGLTPGITRVTLRVRVRPIALEVLRDLVESGHLEQRFVDEMPVLDVLPDRCYPQEIRDAYAEIPDSPCTDEAGFTLVWDDERANAETRSFRMDVVDGAPARCLSHPTYIGTPTTAQQ
jgi:hypothetical protein